MRQPGCDHPHRAHESEVKRHLPLLERSALERAGWRATGVDYEHVEAGQPLDSRLDQRLWIAWLGLVGGQPTRRPDLLAGAFDCNWIARGDEHLRALADKRFRARASQSF